MIRSLFIVFLTASISSCTLLQPSKADGAASPVMAMDPQERAFVEDALADLRSGKSMRLEERFPNAFLARALMGPKAATYSDEQVQSEYIDPLKERFQLGYTSLMEEMRVKGIKPIQLQYVEHRLIGAGVDMPQSIVLVLTTDLGGTHELPMAYTVFGGKWYILEILQTSGIF